MKYILIIVNLFLFSSVNAEQIRIKVTEWIPIQTKSYVESGNATCYDIKPKNKKRNIYIHYHLNSDYY